MWGGKAEGREEERLILKSQVHTDRKRLKEHTLPASSPNSVCLCCTAHWAFSHTNALLPQPNSSCTLATHKNLTLQRKNEKSSFYHLRRSFKKLDAYDSNFVFIKNTLAFWKRLKESKESSIIERKTIVMFVTHIKYMLWWFCYVRRSFKIMEWFVLGMDIYREDEFLKQERKTR